MRSGLLIAVAGLLVLGMQATMNAEEKAGPALQFKMKDIKGKEQDLSQYQGKVILMVNVASKCGLTPQYEALQELYTEYKDDGLVVLGFPANEFGRQEPGTDDQISAFCQENYGVTFPMFSKVVVKGKGQCDLYKYLTSDETNPKFSGSISWNFEKFLINREGEVVARFAPSVTPNSDKVVSAIKEQLKK